jgi:hypothetical protein
MSYREENRQVILTMIREDYGALQRALGFATTAFLATNGHLHNLLSGTHRQSNLVIPRFARDDKSVLADVESGLNGCHPPAELERVHFYS